MSATRDAAEIVSLNVDLLVAVTPLGAVAAKRATTTIPIVFVVVADPVGIKLVDSLARPGGNITGPSILMHDLDAKRLDVFREAVAGLSHVALLADPNDVTEKDAVEGIRAAAKTLGLTTGSKASRSRRFKKRDRDRAPKRAENGHLLQVPARGRLEASS